jgi:hypothetical protein
LGHILTKIRFKKGDEKSSKIYKQPILVNREREKSQEILKVVPHKFIWSNVYGIN